PLNFLRLQKNNVSCVLYDNAVSPNSSSLAAINLLFRPRQHLAEPLLLNRFQQIVQSFHLKCSDRILVISCDKNNSSRHKGSKGFDNIESIVFRHLHIEKQEIRD